MQELRPGVWHWQAPHPDWNPSQYWPREVSSSAIDGGERLLLFDPLAVPAALLEVAAQREVCVVLTAPWHERDARGLVVRFEAEVWAPPPDTAADLARKFAVTPEEAAGGSPDLDWMLAGDNPRAHFYAAGDRLPGGIEVFPGREANDVVLWVERVGAVIPGDTLVDFGRGFEVNEHLRGGITRAELVALLRPLLDLPIELVLPAHGAPTDRAGLEAALL